MIAQDFARVRVLGAFSRGARGGTPRKKGGTPRKEQREGAPLARRQQREGAPLARKETEA